MNDLFYMTFGRVVCGAYAAYDAVTDLTDEMKEKFNSKLDKANKERNKMENESNEELKSFVDSEIKSKETADTKVKEENTNNSKSETKKSDVDPSATAKAVKVESTKKSKVDGKVDIKVKPNESSKIKVETKSESSDKKNNDQKITMQDRRECPVKVLSVEEKRRLENQQKNDPRQHELEHHLHHFVDHLREAGIEFSDIKRMPTGLYELYITQTTGNKILMSFDIDGILYDDTIKFFFGRITPTDEYNVNCFLFTKSSAEALKNGTTIPENCMISNEMKLLNTVLDMQTLKEKDPKKRSATFKNVAKILSDDDINNGIAKITNNGRRPYRFAFCRYTSPEEFSIVSSNKNLQTNLANARIKTHGQIWINYKNGNADLTTK